MRTFEQRITEINRRSDEIIKKRKKMRTRVLAACVPFVLCVCAWSMFALPDLLFCSTDLSDGIPNEQIMETNGEISFIEVSGENNYCLYDEVKVNKILTILNTPGIKMESACDQNPYTQYAAGQISVGANGSDVPEYRFVVNGADGTKTTYTLAGSRLTNEETGEVTMIVGDDLRVLKKLLGLSGKGDD